MAFRLPRFERTVRLTESNGTPTVDFHRWWQSVVVKIEAQEAIQDQALIDLAAAQADILAAQADLAAQLLLIQAAQASADAVTLANAISASWISPASVLSAVDAGSDATITVANFTRRYDDGESVAVTGGDLEGLSYATTYSVYYDDATRADTTPTFVATSAVAEARHNYIAGRHYVDTITTPAMGGGGTTGGGYTPPGGDGGFPIP